LKSSSDKYLKNNAVIECSKRIRRQTIHRIFFLLKNNKTSQTTIRLIIVANDVCWFGKAFSQTISLVKVLVEKKMHKIFFSRTNAINCRQMKTNEDIPSRILLSAKDH